MENDNTSDKGHKPAANAAFIVEVPGDSGPLYAICQTMMIVDGREGLFGLDPALIGRSLELRAGPWPTLTSGGHGAAAMMQSGRNVVIVDQHND